jgi:hypothetical protein
MVFVKQLEVLTVNEEKDFNFKIQMMNISTTIEQPQALQTLESANGEVKIYKR